MPCMLTLALVGGAPGPLYWLHSDAQFCARSILALPPSANATASPITLLPQPSQGQDVWHHHVHGRVNLKLHPLRVQGAMMLLNLPFGPTTAVMAAEGKGPQVVRSRKHLNPAHAC